MFKNLFGPFGVLDDQFSSFFDKAMQSVTKYSCAFPAEISVKDGKTILTIALAGVQKERVKVSIKGGETLTVQVDEEKEATNRFTSKGATMNFILTGPIDNVEPVMKDGLLTITISQPNLKDEVKIVEVK